MPTLRLALAQVNPTVGDLAGNARIVRERARAAAGVGAQLAVFPQLMLTGYPVDDLALRESFVAASRNAVHQLASDLAADGLGALPVIVGYLDGDGPPPTSAEALPGKGPRNAAAVLHGGRVVATCFKHHLSAYGVLDENRYFAPGEHLTLLRIGEMEIALTIGEDLRQSDGPVAAARQAGIGLVVNLNGSPYELTREDVRLKIVRQGAAATGATVASVNLVGGQDELVFDGGSVIVGPEGELLARAPQFVEQLLLHDLELPSTGAALDTGRMPVVRAHLSGELPTPTSPQMAGGIAERVTEEAAVWQALVLALRDYVTKNRFPSVLLGLSGGIDSTVVAAIAVDALGPERVAGISMPSQHSSEHSRHDAADLAKRTGLDYRVEEIQPMVDTFLANISLSGMAVENLQARVRGVILMAVSNQEGHLVLTSSNKSELAVGYSTLYGDSVGGFNPLKDVWKSLVWRLAEWRNAEAARRGEQPPIPENSISKPPSAELRPGQLDTDSLPEYPILDAILTDYIVHDLGRAELLAAGHDPQAVDRVLRLVDVAEYKRRQSAPGPRISLKAFGRDRRQPITSRWREYS
ncbi:MAG TPA: NAD+ synthase [Micromonosporaceae bacterium]|nr:NAD+ synthase [Micromonosporaceae bacterium]